MVHNDMTPANMKEFASGVNEDTEGEDEDAEFPVDERGVSLAALNISQTVAPDVIDADQVIVTVSAPAVVTGAYHPSLR